jgi:hypothetical protein
MGKAALLGAVGVHQEELSVAVDVGGVDDPPALG